MPAVIFGCFLCAGPRPPRPHARSASFCGRNEQRHAVVGEDRPGFVPELAREMLGVLPDQMREVVAAPVRTVEAQLLAWHLNDVSRRLATIPSAGITTSGERVAHAAAGHDAKLRKVGSDRADQAASAPGCQSPQLCFGEAVLCGPSLTGARLPRLFIELERQDHWELSATRTHNLG
jgi:hypothetical protein